MEYPYRYDMVETLKPENANREEARKRTESLTRKLKEEGKMENIKEEIARKIELRLNKKIYKLENRERKTASKILA